MSLWIAGDSYMYGSQNSQAAFEISCKTVLEAVYVMYTAQCLILRAGSLGQSVYISVGPRAKVQHPVSKIY